MPTRTYSPCPLAGQSRGFALGIVLALVGCGAESNGPDEPPIESVEPLQIIAMTPTFRAGAVGEPANVPVVRVESRQGQPVAGARVSFTVADGGSVGPREVRSNGNGSASPDRWILGPRPGHQILTATLDDGQSIRFVVDARAVRPFRLLVTGGGDQQGPVDAPLPLRPAVQVFDQFDNPVPGATLIFETGQGNGSVSPDEVSTDALGVATAGPWTLGSSPGRQVVTVLAPPYDGEASPGIVGFIRAWAYSAGCPAHRGDFVSLRLAFVDEDQVLGSSLDACPAPALTTAIARYGMPAWSPDGRRLAYVEFLFPQGFALFMVEAGGRPRFLASGLHSPAWSPDGRWLLAATTGHYDGDVYRLSPDSGGPPPVRLISMAGRPSWSPDGKRIAFVRLSGDDGYHTLNVVNADGSGDTALTALDEGAIARSSWSPDGSQIAFSKCGSLGCHVYTISSAAVGSTAIRRIDAGNPTDIASDPAWSPDGGTIAYVTGRGDDRRVKFFSVDGGPTPFQPFRGHSPAWRR